NRARAVADRFKSHSGRLNSARRVQRKRPLNEGGCPMLGRQRLLAAWITGLLAVSGTVALLPLASASDISAPTPDGIAIFVNGIESTPSAQQQGKIGTSISFAIYGNLTFNTATQCITGSPQFNASADLSAFDPTLGPNAVFSVPSPPPSDPAGTAMVTYHIVATKTITVTAGSKDGLATGFRGYITARCTADAGGTPVPHSAGIDSTDKVFLDNAKPSLSLVPSVQSGRGGAGSVFTLSLSSISSDIDSYSFDLKDLLSTSPTTVSGAGLPSSSLGPFTLGETDKQNPQVTVSLTDTHGNSNSLTFPATGLDSHRPAAISPTATPKPGPAVQVSWVPLATDTDADNVSVVVKDLATGVSSSPILCAQNGPANGCTKTSDRNSGLIVYNLSSTAFAWQTLHDYGLTLTTVDAVGNTGGSVIQSVSTLSNPSANVQYTPGATRGIGSTFQLQMVNANSQTARVDVDVSSVSSQGVIPVGTTPVNVTVTPHGSPPAMTAQVVGADVNNTPVKLSTRIVDASGNDVTASQLPDPVAPLATNLTAVPRPGGSITVYLKPAASDVDINGFVVASSPSIGNGTLYLPATSSNVSGGVYYWNFTPDLLTMGTTYTFTAHANDNAGNAGALSPSASTRAAVIPILLQLNAVPVAGSLMPTLSGSVLGSGNDGVNVAVTKVVNGVTNYWTWTSGNAFQTTPFTRELAV